MPREGGENIIGSENPADWQENSEGDLELRFDPKIVEHNIKRLERDIQMSRDNQRISVSQKELQSATHSISTTIVNCYADISTGEMAASLSENSLNFTVEFQQIGNFAKLVNFESMGMLDEKTHQIIGFSKRAKENIKQTISAMNSMLLQKNKLR